MGNTKSVSTLDRGLTSLTDQISESTNLPEVNWQQEKLIFKDFYWVFKLQTAEKNVVCYLRSTEELVIISKITIQQLTDHRQVIF